MFVDFVMMWLLMILLGEIEEEEEVIGVWVLWLWGWFVGIC